MRASPIRGGYRAAFCEALDARGDGVYGWPQNVEEPWQLGIRRQAAYPT